MSKKWTFATKFAERPIEYMFSSCIEAPAFHPSRETKRRQYEKALNAALENVLLWEIAARDEGFDVQLITSGYSPHAVLDRKAGVLEFFQSYGVRVVAKTAEQEDEP